MMTGITVITGEPGMGKSSLVKSLYSNIDKYILSYDLTEYKHHRNRLVRVEDLTSTIFQKRASKDYSDFLQELCKQNQIMVVLDSYDEITSTPDFEESALQLIENIARRGIPIIKERNTNYNMFETSLE
ncbi:NACHT domain [Popillia japonica]|uniref:NACHT domain n=1 Tax=Popillia japonica TaxID=7064 RepID=A0AAW1MXX0_POPJA